MLLRVLGVSFDEYTDLKKMFAPYINNDSTKEENYSIFFSENKIKNMYGRDKEFDKLLKKWV